MSGNNFLFKFNPCKVMEDITGISYLLVVFEFEDHRTIMPSSF